MPPVTEIVLVGGDRLRVEEGVEQVEEQILNAARGSLMELAWLTEADTDAPVGLNPEHVVLVRRMEG